MFDENVETKVNRVSRCGNKYFLFFAFLMINSRFQTQKPRKKRIFYRYFSKKMATSKKINTFVAEK